MIFFIHFLTVFASAVHDAKCSNNLEELSIDGVIFQINGSSLSCSGVQGENNVPCEQRVIRFVTKYPDLEHLDLECLSSCTDEMLQNIFQHLVNLKTLSLRMMLANTNLGITGRRGDTHTSEHSKQRLYYIHEIIRRNPTFFYSDDLPQSTAGYSINRLRNLEKLEIVGYHFSMMTDTIFYEFDFPKLRYLLIDPPDDPPTLFPIMGKKLPSLETIYFMSQIADYEMPDRFDKKSEKSLVSFCRHTKKLQTIILRKTSFEENMKLSDIVDVFKVCPSLRVIEGYSDDNASYDPITRTVVITNGIGNLNKTFVIE